jgi:uncharacterized protein
METKHRQQPATAEVAASVADIGRAAWDAVANPGWPSDRPLESNCAGASVAYNPFISFDFLDCLEQSGCAAKRTGWEPRHVVLRDADGVVAAAMPLYRKSHSMGEYVFDHGWADAFQRAGGRYYPKLQASVPFTPVTGRRLLAAGSDVAERERALLNAAADLAGRERASSAHITFMTRDEWELAAECGYLKRVDQQFHFINHGYRDFADFLDSLASRKRKALKRERRDALAGLTVELVTGADLTESAWDAFFDFYMDTGGRKWGRPYLNRRFFSMVGERMNDRILLALARRGSRYIAGALNFIGSDALYGRYWGAIEHQPFLHFELCYYQAIDWAIAHGLARVEAGAQGEHKLARGYMPTPTYSAHWIVDPGFRRAVSDYLVQERRQSALEVEMLSQHTPFKRSGG